MFWELHEKVDAADLKSAALFERQEALDEETVNVKNKMAQIEGAK